MLEEPASVQGGPKLKSHLISTLIILLVLFSPPFHYQKISDRE